MISLGRKLEFDWRAVPFCLMWSSYNGCNTRVLEHVRVSHELKTVFLRLLLLVYWFILSVLGFGSSSNCFIDLFFICQKKKGKKIK